MENANPSCSTSNRELLDPEKKKEIESWLDNSRIVDSLAREIMNKGLESRQKPSNPSKNHNFVGRVRGLKVFIGNFAYKCNFMILEDTTSVIDHHLGEVVFGKPFARKTGLVYGRCWNDPRDFAKPVNAIVLPQDVPSTSNRHLIEIENQVQLLIEAHLALTQPTQKDWFPNSWNLKMPDCPSLKPISNDSKPEESQDNEPDVGQEEKGNLGNINSNPHSQPDPLASIATEQVRKLNSMLESLGLVPQSSNTKFVCTKEDDIEVMFIEMMMNHKMRVPMKVKGQQRKDRLNEEDKRRGVDYVTSKILRSYKECLELGPKYVTGLDDEGEVTLYLMRRNLKVLRKFHWMILGGRFNQLSYVSSPLLSNPGSTSFFTVVILSLYSFQWIIREVFVKLLLDSFGKLSISMSPPIRRKYHDSVAFATGCKRIKNSKRCNRKIRIPIAMWPCRVEEKMTLKEVDGQTVEEIETKIIAKDGTITRVPRKFQGYETSEEEPVEQPRRHDLYRFVDHPQLQQGNPMNEFAPHRLPQPKGNMNGWLIEDKEEVERNEVDSDLESTASSKPVWKKTTKADHDRASRGLASMITWIIVDALHKMAPSRQSSNNDNNNNENPDIAAIIAGNDGGGNENGGNNGCTFKAFQSCNPKVYDGKGGAIVLTRWIEKMENMIDNSGCTENQKVRYAASSLVNKALTWWNTQVQARGREAAMAMTWNDFKALMVEEFCPTTQPTTIQNAILRAGILTDEVVSCGTLTKGNDKRKVVEESGKSGGSWKDNKKAKVGTRFVATAPPRNEVAN
ncbi:hypothetical protein Tco_1449126 [Tanacetum coccineum]